MLAFAGLYELWRDKDRPDDDPDSWLWTATIITTRAEDEVGRIHDRMPMVIEPARWADWLDPTATSAEALHGLMTPAASVHLTTYPVSTEVNSVRHNGPGLIEPMEGDSEPAGAPRAGAGGAQRRLPRGPQHVVLRPLSAARPSGDHRLPRRWCPDEAGGSVETITVRKRLETARDDLDRSIAVLRGERPMAGGADSPQDEADVGTSLSEADRAEAVLASAMSQRTEVMDALERIQAGSYGKCADCGKPIPEGRLEARPEASRCVACQSKRDRLRR